MERDGFPYLRVPLTYLAVKKTDFVNATIGLGVFGRPAVVWSTMLKRGDFEALGPNPGWGIITLKQLASESTAFVEVSFTDEYERVLRGRSMFVP